MIEGIKESIQLNNILKQRYGDKDSPRLDQLYKEVFSTDSGKLILQDLANRCCIHKVFIEGDHKFTEGMRSVVVTIQSRIRNATEGNNNALEDS